MNEQTNLIVQYYRCDTAERQAEIDTCLKNNLLNPHFATIHLLTEEQFDTSSFPSNDKIVQAVIGERLTFERAFMYANEVDPAGQMIWVLCNADIYFDDTLRLVERKNLEGTVYALTRHDVQPDGTTKLVDEAFAHGSQDAWMFTTPVDTDRMFTQFRLGIPGCDNRIAYELIQSGYLVVNPSKAVVCHHLDLTREISISARTATYMQMHTAENIKAGRVAPPPYQFYIYSTDIIGPELYDIYSKTQQKLLELTDRTDELRSLYQQIAAVNNQLVELRNETDRQIAERDQQIEERDQQIAERDQQISFIFNSLSWKITLPFRVVLDLINRKR